MAQPPTYKRHVESEDSLSGFSAIAPGFWRTAEKLRDEAVKQTAKASWQVYYAVHSAICLYHAALECFINEEITLRNALVKASLPNSGYQIQSMTLNEKKLDEFFCFFGLKGKNTPDIRRRVLLLAGLRNRLAHHWPVLRDVRDYPVQVIDALTDARIERVNTDWTAQCSDVRLAKWAADIVRAFVDEWWRIGRIPGEVGRSQWEFGPDWVYPPNAAATQAPAGASE